MNYHRIIEGILDIGEEMLKSGRRIIGWRMPSIEC